MQPHQDQQLIALIMAAHLDPELSLDPLKDYIQEKEYLAIDLFYEGPLRKKLWQSGIDNIQWRKLRERLQIKHGYLRGITIDDLTVPAIPFPDPQ